MSGLLLILPVPAEEDLYHGLFLNTHTLQAELTILPGLSAAVLLKPNH